MSWFNKLLGTKESAIGRMIVASILGRAVYPKRDYALFAKEGYQQNVIAYRCIELISTAAASVPWLMYTDKDDEVEDDPILDLLRRPNPMQTGKEFFTGAYAYDLMAGNSYVERVMVDSNKRMKELWAHRPDRMKIIPGRFGLPSAYRYTVGGSTPKDFPCDPTTGVSDILHVKRFNPLDDFYGQSPLEAIGASVDSHSEATRWNFSLLRNGARPSGALEYEGTMDDAEFARLKGEIEHGYGKEKVGRPMLLQGGLKWVQMMLSAVDMDWLEGKDKSAGEIAVGFNVPEQLVGVKGQQTYNNYREARLAMYEDAVLPLLDRWAEAMTNWIRTLPGYEDKRLGYDADEIPALTPRREALWDKVQAADFLTVDEKREALGYEEYKPGEKPGQVIFVSASELPLTDTGFLTDINTPPEMTEPELDEDGNPIAPAVPGDAPLASGGGVMPTGGAPVQDLALNGTQITAVVSIVQNVVDDLLPPESAIQLLLVAFPSIDEATAHLLIDPAAEFEKPEPDPLPMMPGVPPGTPGVPPKKPAPPKTPVEKHVMRALLQLKGKHQAARHRKAYRLAYGGKGEGNSVNVNVKSPDIHLTPAEVNVDARTTVAKDAINTDNRTTNNEIKEVLQPERDDPTKYETIYVRDPVTQEIIKSRKVPITK